MSMTDALARIKISAKELKGIAEESAARIAELNRFLAKNPPGIEVWGDDICYERVMNCRGHAVDGWYELGYARSDEGRLTIALKCVAQQTDESGNPVYAPDQAGEKVPADETVWVRPLVAAPPELRIAAISHLPDLMVRLAAACEGATKKAKAEMEKFAAAAQELKAALGGQ
ncbi:MAG: hypothetical protein ABSE73_06720 [Planctomycetota bacterium]